MTAYTHTRVLLSSHFSLDVIFFFLKPRKKNFPSTQFAGDFITRVFSFILSTRYKNLLLRLILCVCAFRRGFFWWVANKVKVHVGFGETVKHNNKMRVLNWPFYHNFCIVIVLLLHSDIGGVIDKTYWSSLFITVFSSKVVLCLRTFLVTAQ